MLTLETLLTELKKIAPTAYWEFAQPQSPPFIAVVANSNNDFLADNQNYVAITNVYIEFYANKKDLATEIKIETMLKANGHVYGKSEEHISDEKLLEIIYTIQLIGG